jgi:hypothetical protein
MKEIKIVGRYRFKERFQELEKRQWHNKRLQVREE